VFKAISQKVATKTVGDTISKIGNKADNLVKKGAEIIAKNSSKIIAKVETNAVGKIVVKSFEIIGHKAEHIVAKGIDKVAGKGITKTATVVAEKIGVKAATRLGAMVPIAGVAVGAYITKHDYDDFKAKMKDPSVTKTSKVLARSNCCLRWYINWCFGNCSCSCWDRYRTSCCCCC
jgi:hypothetical protein